MVRHTGEDFINEKGIATAQVFSFQSSSVQRAEFDAPKADRFTSDCNAAFGQEIFDIPVAEIESVVEPDGIGNYVKRESVTLIDTHSSILAISAS